MTDRQRFEAQALKAGANVAVSTPTMLKIIATDGKLLTTYYFTKDGKFEFNTHTFLKKLINKD